MSKTSSFSQIRQFIYSLFIITSLVILIDFIVPGNRFVENDFEIKKEEQQYFNAAGNSHFSFKVITEHHGFSVSENFALQIQEEHQTIQYHVSRVFKEVNRYGLANSKNKSIHSLRIFSGLILPLFVIVILLVVFQKEGSLSTLVFVLQVLLVADIVFLMI